MIKIKVSIPHSAPPIIRQTPNSSARWGDCCFYINTDIEECDYWFVLDELNQIEKTYCPLGNVVLITGEPPSVKLYPHKYVDQFSSVLTCQRNLLRRENALCSNPALPWMVGAQLKSLPAEWDMENYLDYNFFNEEHVLNKKDKIVVITSNKTMTRGHRQRLDFVLGLKERIPELMDIYGAGFNKVDDKYDILSMYKYSLVMENCRYRDYWTEKLSDAYLSLTFPFYSGCLNLDSYFDKSAFEIFDLEDIDKITLKIKNAIKSDLYSCRKHNILSAKKDVLDKYNLFAIMSDYVSKNEMKGKKGVKTECKIQPLYRTFETRVRTRILKYLGWEI